MKYINPDGFSVSSRYTQMSETPPSTPVFISGQAGGDSTGKLVATESRGQAQQAFENIKVALAA